MLNIKSVCGSCGNTAKLDVASCGYCDSQSIIPINEFIKDSSLFDFELIDFCGYQFLIRKDIPDPEIDIKLNKHLICSGCRLIAHSLFCRFCKTRMMKIKNGTSVICRLRLRGNQGLFYEGFFR